MQITNRLTRLCTFFNSAPTKRGSVFGPQSTAAGLMRKGSIAFRLCLREIITSEPIYVLTMREVRSTFRERGARIQPFRLHPVKETTSWLTFVFRIQTKRRRLRFQEESFTRFLPPEIRKRPALP